MKSGDANWSEEFGFVSRRGTTIYKTECCSVEAEWDDDEGGTHCPKCKDSYPDTYTEINYDY